MERTDGKIGQTVSKYGGVPFFGVMEMSLHFGGKRVRIEGSTLQMRPTCSTQPYWDIGPFLTWASMERRGGNVTLVQVGVVTVVLGMTVYVA